MTDVATIDVPTVEKAIGVPVERWAARCHEISLAMVRTMWEPGEARVARGFCEGVLGQHSWVVTGYDIVDGRHVKPDCYDPSALIIDPTLWSYLGAEPQIWTGTLDDGRHAPHGRGNIWEYGRPAYLTEAPVTLTPSKPWSSAAEDFLAIIGPLDRRGWAQLAHCPVEGWPAGEIIEAMLDSGMEAVVPIDIVGMVTDRNPSKLYLREP